MFVDERNRIANVYDSELKNLPIHLPNILKGNKSSFHLYIIRLNDREKFFS